MTTILEPPTFYKSASLRLQPLQDQVYILRSLYSIKPRQGHATGLLELVTAWADRSGVTLLLTAKQYGNVHGMTDKQLVKFYQKFGFVLTEEAGSHGYPMVRAPQ
jgi:GNAT superfamily N-acetyltransferase